MDSHRWRQIEDLYNAALTCESKQRFALLEQADPDIKREVELMLAQDGSAMDRPASEGLLDASDATLTQVAPGKQLGRYEIEKLLGAGGMGEVYRARDTQLGRAVAIKRLPRGLAADPALRRRFLHEARAASALNHPNIVVLHDISRDGEVDFFVMEYVAGQTL